jgi:hypothetical protein
MASYKSEFKQVMTMYLMPTPMLRYAKNPQKENEQKFVAAMRMGALWQASCGFAQKLKNQIKLKSSKNSSTVKCERLVQSQG